MIYLTNINLNQNELQNAILQPLAVAPSNPKLGQIYTDSTSNKIKWYNGTKWTTVGVVVESSETNGNIVVDENWNVLTVDRIDEENWAHVLGGAPEKNLVQQIDAILSENSALKDRITAAETENAALRNRIAAIETFLSSKVFMTQE